MNIKRNIYKDLLNWKESKDRKPLLLFGVRQVGKTFLLTKQFAPSEFQRFHIFNVAIYGESLRRVFQRDFDIKRILIELSLLSGASINLDSDLIIFDEVQEDLSIIEALKYFYEENPKAYIIATGSMLRVKLTSKEVQDDEKNKQFNYPVGKVSELFLYPLNFKEFIATKASRVVIDAYNEGSRSLSAHDKLLDYYLEYLFVGGMPEAVVKWVDESTSNIDILERSRAVRKVHEELLSAYKRDFIGKGNVINGTHLAYAYDALFTQVQHAIFYDSTNKRFKFKSVIPKKSRFSDLQNILDWIENAGLAHKVYVINSNPLTSPDAFVRHNIFKLIPHDIGLTNAKLNISYKEILLDKLGLVKGALAEIFVANELKSSYLSDSLKPLIAWSSEDGRYEVEYLLKDDKYGVYPLEVKGGDSTKSISLNRYKELYKPKITCKLSTRAGGLSENANITIPIYYAASHREFALWGDFVF